MPNVVRDVHRGSAEAADCIGNIEIYLSRICLDGNVESCREASLLAENLVELVDFRSIITEDLQE